MASSSLTPNGGGGRSLGIESDKVAEPPVALAENVRGMQKYIDKMSNPQCFRKIQEVGKVHRQNIN